MSLYNPAGSRGKQVFSGLQRLALVNSPGCGAKTRATLSILLQSSASRAQIKFEGNESYRWVRRLRCAGFAWGQSTSGEKQIGEEAGITSQFADKLVDQRDGVLISSGIERFGAAPPPTLA